MTAPARSGTRLPHHVAVIMDGNGRWAERQGLARTAGHSQGEERLAEIVRAADALGISWLTAYGFSTENWRRPRLEVDFILGLHRKIFGRRQEMHANNVRIRWIGRDVRAGSRIPSVVRREIDRSTRLTADNTGLNFTVAFDYGGRQELVEAARAIANQQPDRVDVATVGRNLYEADMPPVDLMVRTSGEGRISNFLLWEGVGAHLYVTPTLWPDFGTDELRAAVDWWSDQTSVTASSPE
jgi:undecaprenyl diphosphate synthase